MPDDTTTTEAAPPDTPEWRQKIEDKIDRLADLLRGGHAEQGSETEPDQPTSMAAEVRREVERLRQAEDAQRREAERDAKVAELDGRVTQVAEKQPREYRRSTRIMKWATEDDK